MSEAHNNLLNEQMTAAAEASVDKVEAVLAPVFGRGLTNVERQIARSLFWSRAKATAGDWVDLVSDGHTPRIGVTLSFERAYVAFAARTLNGAPLVAGAPSRA